MWVFIVTSQNPSKPSNIEPREIIPDKLKYIYWAGLISIILLTVFIRLRLLEIPLESDEGEFAYIGRLILQGVPPYLLTYSLKLPGTPAAYALFMYLFGQSIAGIHLGLIFVNSSTIILVYLIAARLFDRFTGLIAGSSFAILSLSPTVFGTSANATHFVMLPALGGLLLMLKFMELERKAYIFWSGILLGVAFLMKQHAIFFIIFACVYPFFKLVRERGPQYINLLKLEFLFLMGVAIPFAATCIILYFAGVFDKFWFWTFSFALQYASQGTFSQGVKIFIYQLSVVIDQLYCFWGLAVIGAGILIVYKKYRDHLPFVLGFLIFSFLAICPAFYFFNSYFILFLPAVSLLIGISIRTMTNYIGSKLPVLRSLPMILFLTILLFGLFEYRGFFFELTPIEARRSMYECLPFIESIEIAKYIESHSTKEDKIAVLGSEPEIYFYANRRSATGYLYTYELMRDQELSLQMQEQMIEELEKAKPEYLVYVNNIISWVHPYARQSPHMNIVRWAEENMEKNYYQVGIIDILSENHTEYRWDNEALNFSPRSKYFILVFKRKDGKAVFNVNSS